MMPLLPPDDHYQASRDRWDGPGSRRKTRHASSLDLHELGYADDSLRPDPLWMAIRRTMDWIGRFQVVRALQDWLDRPEKVESAATSRSDECGLPHKRIDTGTAPSRSGPAL